MLHILLILCLIVIVILIIVVIAILVKKNKEDKKLDEFSLNSYIIPGHEGGKVEFGERDVAFKFTKKSACVLEFGGGSGSVSAVIQKILTNPRNHVVIEPADSENKMFGGLSQLKKNKQNGGHQYTIIDRFLKPNENLTQYVSKPFDTIVVDCENCLVGEYNKNPHLFESVTQIQVERDDFDDSYTSLFRDVLGMKKIYSGPHVQNLKIEVWVRN